MRTLFFLFSITLSLTFGVFGQPTKALNNSLKMEEKNVTLSNLLNKKWKFHSYEIEGYKFPFPDTTGNDYLIFLSDSTVKSIDRGLIMKSRWTYNESNKTITLTADNTDEKNLATSLWDGQKNIMKIISLTEESFVFQTTTEDGTSMTIYANVTKE